MKASRLRKLSKRLIAERQIYRAILVLEEQDDPVSAITLAGASEEILGNMLRDKGIECAFEAKVRSDKAMWAFAKKRAEETGFTLDVPEEKEIKLNTNRIRNGLKHSMDGRPVETDYYHQAEEMIARAISNYRVLYDGKTPPQKRVARWFEDYVL